MCISRHFFWLIYILLVVYSRIIVWLWRSILSVLGTNGSVADFATDLQGGYFASDCTINGTDLGKVT